MGDLLIKVRDMAGLETCRPVTGGVPLGAGMAPQGSAFALCDDAGHAVPLQTSVLARWQDGSVRWLLLDFQARPAAHGIAPYVLSWGNGGAGAAPDDLCEVNANGSLRTGAVSVTPSDRGLLTIADRFDVVFILTAADGRVCAAVPESRQVEVAGPLRSTVMIRGDFRSPEGERLFQFRLRVSLYAGASQLRLEPLILVDADCGVMQLIRSLEFAIRPRGAVRSWCLGGDRQTYSDVSPARLLQIDDEQYRLEGCGGSGGKAPGWAEADDGSGTVAVALRDFWQQWPKSFEVAVDGLSVGLFPRFAADDFAHMEPWYKHQYLFDGEYYRLRTGQARRWDVWIDLAGGGDMLARAANAPLIPAADPAQALATGVWDAIAPAGIPELPQYDTWADNLFNAYCESIRSQRDYGAMNWGDWFGERYVNWGNHEYDTANQLLIQFARTGDPKYFYVADAAARHSAEVDTVHHVNPDLAVFFGPSPGCLPRAGMVHQHTIGHVSGFYGADTVRELFVEKSADDNPNPYLCLDPYNLGHIWTQGMARHYFLTGDPFVRETVDAIGNNLAQLVADGEYQFMGHSHCGRTTGWTLLALGGAYEIDLDEKYLQAMRCLADAAVAEQDPNCGGWLYSLPRGHCYCEKLKHVGMAGFITAVLINGLSRYYLLTGDERLPAVIEHAITFLNNDTWHEEWRDWRYTSCPATKPMQQMGVLVMAEVNSVRITGNAEHLRILRVAWEEKFRRLLDSAPGQGQGKTYTATMYGCAEAAGLLAMRR